MLLKQTSARFASLLPGVGPKRKISQASQQSRQSDQNFHQKQEAFSELKKREIETRGERGKVKKVPMVGFGE